MIYPQFPDGILLKKHVGRIIRVQGVQYRLERLMAEKYDRHLVQRVALFEAKKSGAQETAVVKCRFQMDPDAILETDREAILIMALNWFREEARCLQACETRDHRTPKFYGKEELVQGSQDLYPRGYMHVIAMSKVPGSPVTSFSRFTWREIEIIRKQLAEILEYTRQKGCYYILPNKEDLFFDRTSMHTALVGFAGLALDDNSNIDPITESSFEVTAFGLESLPHGRR
ncbi:hypothetical protein DTO271G3_7489 [Paecilomyces variotii]|nr:hypothetical protein DTO271G3_7489 [Paecilomyces variotii]